MTRSVLASLFFGVLAIILVMRITGEARGSMDYGNLRATVVATRDILEGEIIDDAALRVERIPEVFRRKFAVADPLNAVDRVARVPIAQDDQIDQAALTTGPVRSVSELLPEGHRAFTIDVAGGIDARLLVPGDLVDVIAIFESTQDAPAGKSGGAGPMKARTLLQNRIVLATGDLYPGSPRGIRMTEGDRARQRRSGTARAALRRVTLAATTAEAQSLGLASETSELYLSLRGRYTDEGVVPLSPLATPDLFHETVRRKRTRWSIFEESAVVP